VQAYVAEYGVPLNETRNLAEVDLVAAVDGYAIVSGTLSVVCSASSVVPCEPVGGTPEWRFIVSDTNDDPTGVPHVSGPYGPEYRETTNTMRVFPISAGTTRYRFFARNSGGSFLTLFNVTLVAQFVPAGG
jgi:hypothetical protein